MQSILKTPNKPIPSKTVQSINLAYPTAATAFQFNPLSSPGAHNPSPNIISNFQTQCQISSRQFLTKKNISNFCQNWNSKRPPLAIPTCAPLPGKYNYQSKIIASQGTHS
ncbi:unnamed protein product [Paramecium octaurelia]|uniref:Uncharacterized protein n=1 Tax=Paramecium octaurelia TaxID=43137 RepID=A0A8S1Y2K8_PAROT|nr:unnamed protein product [Paramecium octaurelia]